MTFPSRVAANTYLSVGWFVVFCIEMMGVISTHVLASPVQESDHDDIANTGAINTHESVYAGKATLAEMHCSTSSHYTTAKETGISSSFKLLECSQQQLLQKQILISD